MADPSMQQEHDERTGQPPRPPSADPVDPAEGHEPGGPTGPDAGESDDSWRDLSTPETAEAAEASRDEPARNMIPARLQRSTKVERASMRVLATGGIVGLATILGAILVSQDVAGWIVGLSIGLVSVLLAGVLWSSRQM
jgi:hypothetical protein